MGFRSYSLEKDYYEKRWAQKEGWQELLLVGGALKAGFFDVLGDRALSSNEMAEVLKADQRAVKITLEALVDRGYLRQRGERGKGTYALSSEADKLFRDKNNPHYLGFSIRHSLRLIERWLTLPQVTKTGQPISGNRFTEGTENFVKAMDQYSRDIASPVARICLKEAPNINTLIDIGGGVGTFSCAFAEKGLEVTLFDLPEVIAIASLKLQKNKTIKLISGDFNKNLPQGPFDFAFLGNVTHIYGPYENRDLFRRASKVLKVGGYIAILDFVRGRSPSGSFFGINMLVNTDRGGTWKEEEYCSWLKESGFLNVKIYDLEKRDQQLIIACKS